MLQNNLELVKKLDPLIGKLDIEYYTHDNLVKDEVKEILNKRNINILSDFMSRTLDYWDPDLTQSKFVQAVVDNKWERDRDYLNPDQSDLFQFRLISLIYSKRSEVVDIIKFYYPKLDKLAQHILIRAMIQTGREQEVNWMSQYVPDFFTLRPLFKLAGIQPGLNRIIIIHWSMLILEEI